jgi:murein DD-endopeptidase MepM/ murein hydrolase activator NlpD
MSKKLLSTNIKQKLYSRNRFVILDEDTFEEKFAFQLSLMNVFVLVGLSAIFLIIITALIIAYTPLRELIPGYTSSKLKSEAINLALKYDKLEKELDYNNNYIQAVQKILTGELDYAKFHKDSLYNTNELANVDEQQPSKDEIKLREAVEQEDKYNYFEKTESKLSMVFFQPAKGIITDGFNRNKKHFAIDIALPKDTPIKSIANGHVVFSDWTPSTGHVVIISHQQGIMSVYKHLSSSTKSISDFVRSGEVIAMSGNTGYETTGVHLHFELWKDGVPINPKDYINFE